MDFVGKFFVPGLFNGLCYGIGAIGISLSLRFLGMADFTAVGSFMIGGIVSIIITNISGSWLIGLVCGAIAAGLLGVLTSFLWLNSLLKIPLMLSGIICFTASRSLGLAVTNSATVELNNSISFLRETFAWSDIYVVLFLAISICLGGGVLARSKLGCRAFAMCSNNYFLKFRHRSNRSTTCMILFLSNFLVGLSGGLINLKLRTAYAEINLEFLSLTLGAIYAGDAVVRLTARLLKKNLPAELPLETQVSPAMAYKGYWESFRLSLTTQRDDSERMWFILLSYILASIALNNVAVSVRNHSMGDISPEWEHFIVACIIILGLFLSNYKRERAI